MFILGIVVLICLLLVVLLNFSLFDYCCFDSLDWIFVVARWVLGC